MMREKIKRQAITSLHTFIVHYAWPVLQPGTTFIDNWHVRAMCDHLEAVHSGQIKRLIINIPFRMLKSTIVSQAFPAWEWLSLPSLQYLTASYAKDLATRDAVDSRRIMESDTYLRDFGDKFTLTSDQNVKTRYENDKRGMRIVTSTDAGATGFGGNRLLVDDPINVKQAASLLSIQESVEWWRGTMATRYNNPGEDSAVITHQRVNTGDLSGYLLREEPESWEHLVLPMRYDPKIISLSSIGYKDPRSEEGELLMPQRLGESDVKALEKSLGIYHTKAQLQQAPEDRGGNLFKRGDWQYYTALPEIVEVVLSVDCTFKDNKTSDNVAIQAWGLSASGVNKYLLHRICDKLGFKATVDALRSTIAVVNDRFGDKVIAVLIEDKANGSAVIETLKDEIAGVIPIEPEGGKYARADAVQPEHEAGNWYIPDPSVDPKIEEYLFSLGSFPNPSVQDDDVDSTTQCMNWLKKRVRTGGLMEFMKHQNELLEKKRQTVTGIQ
jgi:predicted phage terminase large subunit-like protein